MAEDNGDFTEQQPTAAAAAAATAGSDDGMDLQAQLEAARGEAAQYKDKYLREYADRENFRRRQERTTAERIRYEKRELIARVLEVVDNLDRALRYADTMARDDLHQTLRIVQGQLNDVLKSEGLSPVAAVGEPFDPRVHEAIESVTSDEHPEGVVVEEVRKGYRQGDETLRPARVKVSAGPQA